jgi:hypothetical protein
MLPECMRALATPASISGEERRFGLRTDAYKSVWKLHVIALAHPQVFSALARWVGFGGRLLFVKGNHDLELHWTEVCESIVAEIAQRVHSGWGHAGRSRDRILFSEDGFRIGNISIEHGHRWETITAVPGSPTVGEQRRELRLPPGAIAGRYLLNLMESPTGTASTLSEAGLLAGVLFIALGWITMDGAAATIPLVLGAGVACRAAWPRLAGILHLAGEQVVTRMSVADVRAGALEVLQGLRRSMKTAEMTYAVMGHTHVHEVRRMELGGDSAGAWYVNTGTWSPGWVPAARGARMQSVYRFVRFTLWSANQYSLETLEWDDEIQLPTWSGDQPAHLAQMERVQRAHSDYQIAHY